ncbi:MAG: HPr family phosphocarrier protein [Victivallales bacterium]
MVERKIVIRNQAGIHCRPSSMILMAAQEFSGCKFKVASRNGDSDLTSILSLISLGLERGNEVTITADGAEEEAALEKIAHLFSFEFDFPRE